MSETPKLPGNPPLVLAIEDEQPILRFLRTTLGGHGYRLVETTTGEEGLRQAATRSPDLVLLDLGLPELDGLAVYETLRHAPATATVPIIIVTGLPDGAARCAGLHWSHCELVSKPVNPRCLIARMKELLRQPRRPAGGPSCEKGKAPAGAARATFRATDGHAGLEAGSRFQHGQASTAKRH
jgi:DNA-binding response OmpR family regulator